MASSSDLATLYQKKNDIEHILDAPDTYIGSIEKDATTGWTFANESEESIVHKTYSFIPGLYKCFDEGIVNARDHFIRMKQKPGAIPVKNIEVNVDKESGMITILNDGNGIDVEKHPVHDLWIPEMIFGHLRTSTNYNKSEKKIVGGKNGFGFKLVLIYSTWGRIETVDSTRGLKYVQEFKSNLTEILPPKVTKCKGKPYTKVSWIPDYARFGVSGLDEDTISLFKKRTYDIAALTDKDVKVSWNGNLIKVKTFEQYVDLFVGSKGDVKRIYEEGNERWEYCVCMSPLDEFTQISFVNGIYTAKGGKHVEYLTNQIVRKISDYIEEKKKVKVKPITIKEQLMVFVNCIVENPSFDSQTKDYLTTSSSKFGSTCKVSEKFIQKVVKLGVMNQAISINQIKQSKESKKTDGRKTRTIRGIPKLIDANYAGTTKSKDCILILCEGDSAKAGIVSGLSKEDRNTIGVYPLKGKLMNVRDASVDSINKNNEISELKKILGLESNKKYKDAEDIQKNLRYRKVLFMTDQDLDGTHIKGLCINMFQSQWSELSKVCSFMGFMNTPILKARKGSQERSFYNEKEYNDWKKENNDGKGWSIKYYKGLGTSTGKEFREYFKDRKVVEFAHSGSTCDESIDMVFRKTRSDDRKDWLSKYDKDLVLDTSKPSITYDEFVNRELVHFSKYDCDRSIPNVMDGLKTSLRKILYSAFKRKLYSEIKVAQFGGYVSEHSGYHHGEASLMKAIVGMAQEFVGSNNINLLMPNGQFGTRLQGGDDSASERYIFTHLNKIVKALYPEHDQPVLNYLDDDGTLVEPEYYVPILPMILVNGAKGIGTGFSTDIPSFNPIDCVNYIKHYLENGTYASTSFIPYYEGFKGTIQEVSPGTFVVKASYEIDEVKETVHITELPVKTWTDNYKQFLEKAMDPESDKKKKKKIIIKDYTDMSTDTNVDITIQFVKGELKALMAKKNKTDYITAVENYLNLTSMIQTSNMHLFDEKQQLKKYKNPQEIIQHYIPIRLDYYQKRKEHMLDELKKQATLLTNKSRFIIMQLDDTIDLRRKSKQQVVDLLKGHKFDMIGDDEEYKYLRSMPIDSVIQENVDKLLKEKDEKMKQIKLLEKTTIQTMWKDELVVFEREYEIYRKERQARASGTELKKKLKVKKVKKVKKSS
jgi:DNA topoisomerase-2